MNKEQRTILAGIIKELKCKNPIYQGHPLLKRQASYSRLSNLPMSAVQRMCRQLDMNVEGLLRLLEKERVVLEPKKMVHGLHGLTQNFFNHEIHEKHEG